MKTLILMLISALTFTDSLAQQATKPYVGEFQVRPGFNVHITLEHEELFIQPTGKPKEKLTKIKDALYHIESIDGTIDFRPAPAQDKVILKMYGQIIHAPKLPIPENLEVWEEINMEENELLAFVGEYHLTADASFIISNEKGALFAQLTGQPKFQIYPYTSYKFYYKVVKASIEFVKSEGGQVIYLLLHQNGIIIQADKS